MNNAKASSKPSPFRNFISLSSGYWRGPGTTKAWLLTGLVLCALFGQIAMQVAANAWTRFFYDALQRRALDDVWRAVLWLPGLVFGTAIIVSILVVSRMTFQVRWRHWLTNKISGWWVDDQRYYRLGFVAPDQSAPEYRIAEDVRLSIEPLVDFALGLISAIITAATFATILWQVAGALHISFRGVTYDIPGYMAAAAVLYAILTSLAAYVAGHPLVGKIADKNEAEANFRSEMTRLRENAESIALIRGDADELNWLRQTYQFVVDRWLEVIKRQGVIALVLNTNGSLFPIIPILLATPKFLSGQLSLGAMMQVVAAFSAVQGALIWFVDNFVRLAEWYASARRVTELTDALSELDIGTFMEDQTAIKFDVSHDGAIHLENLSVADRGGRVVINDASTKIEPGEKVLIAGESGTGKSTLIRAIAGLWPWGSGTVRLPEGIPLFFLPQRPYLPLGTLRDVVLYPAAKEAISDEDIKAALKRCGLSYMSKRLDEENVRWNEIMSGGERQRVAFVRLLLQKPKIIVMDEATSALDEDSQTSLLSLLREDLSEAMVISIGHRAGIEDFHDKKIILEKRVAGAQMTSRSLPKSLWHMFNKREKRN